MFIFYNFSYHLSTRYTLFSNIFSNVWNAFYNETKYDILKSNMYEFIQRKSSHVYYV